MWLYICSRQKRNTFIMRTFLILFLAVTLSSILSAQDTALFNFNVRALEAASEVTVTYPSPYGVVALVKTDDAYTVYENGVEVVGYWTDEPDAALMVYIAYLRRIDALREDLSLSNR